MIQHDKGGLTPQPRPGDYRCVQTNANTFIVQRAVMVAKSELIRSFWRTREKTHTGIEWQSIRDTTQPLLAPGMRPPLHPVLSFTSLDAAQIYVDKVRRDATTYPILHPLK